MNVRWIKAAADNRKGYIWVPISEKDFNDVMFWKSLKEKESATAIADSENNTQR